MLEDWIQYLFLPDTFLLTGNSGTTWGKPSELLQRSTSLSLHNQPRQQVEIPLSIFMVSAGITFKFYLFLWRFSQQHQTYIKYSHYCCYSGNNNAPMIFARYKFCLIVVSTTVQTQTHKHVSQTELPASYFMSVKPLVLTLLSHQYTGWKPGLMDPNYVSSSLY